MNKHHDVVPLGPKSKRAQYKEGQRGGEDWKDKSGEKNRRDERGRKSHCRNKLIPVVGENSSSEASVYYHIIYWCYQKLMILG